MKFRPVRSLNRIAICAVSLLLLVSSCDSDEATGSEVERLVLSETAFALGIGAALPLTAYEQMRDGASTERAEGVSWSTSDADVVSVDQTGIVRGVSLGGPVTVTATRAGRTAQVTIIVVPASVEVTPRISTMAVGASVQFSAVPLDAAGTPIDAAAPVWSVASISGNQVATITADGRLTVNAPGVVSVRAMISGQEGNRAIGVPSAFDGTWAGQAPGSIGVEFVVQYGVVSSFRLPTTVRQSCSRQALSLQTAVISAENRFAMSLSSLSNLVTGTFASPTSMTGSFGEIPTIDGCSGTSEGPVPAQSFSAARQ